MNGRKIDHEPFKADRPVPAVPALLYRVEEAAEALRLSRSCAVSVDSSGRLRTVKCGRRRLVPVEALAEYVASLRDGGMTKRRLGEGGLHWDESRQRWIASVTVGYDGRGKRIVRSASGRTRTEAKAKLRDLLHDKADGYHGRPSRCPRCSEAVEDGLIFGLPRRQVRATVNKVPA